MSYLNRAAPAPKRRDLEPPEPREYIIVSDRCTWGKPGDIIELALTDNQELSLIEAGTLKAKPPTPVEAKAKPAAAKAAVDEKPPTPKGK